MPPQLREIRHGDVEKLLNVIGWSKTELARRLDCDRKMVDLWDSADRLIPVEIYGWLWNMAALVRRTEPPLNWRNRKKKADDP